MLEIVESSSAAARLGAATGFLNRLAKAGEVLVIGASRAAADDFVRSYPSAAKATFGIHRFSFLQLVARIAAYELAQQGFVPLSSLGEQTIAARAVFEVKMRGLLGRFTPVGEMQGFPRALARTFSELRSAGMTTGNLQREASLHDLNTILEEFEAELGHSNSADRAAVFETATEVLRSKRHPFCQKPVLLLDVSIELACEQLFIRELCSRAPAALITVPSGDERTLVALTTAPGAQHRVVNQAQQPASLSRVQQFLFKDLQQREDLRDPHVCFFSAPGEARECIEIARRIVQEAANGVVFDRIGIGLRAPEIYTPLLETALARAGIPAYFAAGTKRPDISGRAFLALLACTLEDLSAKRFAEYLSLAQVPHLDERGAPPVDRGRWVPPDDEITAGLAQTEEPEAVTEPQTPDGDETPVLEGSLRAPWRWEQLLVESAVIGSADRWRRRLTGLESELKLKLSVIVTDDPGAPRARNIERQLRDVDHLRRFTMPVVEELATLPKQAIWNVWLDALDRLAPRVLRKPDRVMQLLAEMRSMGSVGPVSLDDVYQVLGKRLTEIREKPPNYRFGQVFIGAPEQFRGRSFEVIFVPGLAERIFPQRPREDPVLLDTARQHVPTEELPLLTQAGRVAAERLLLRLMIGSVSQKLYISYPRFEVALARPRVPSFYAFDLKRTLSGRVPKIDEFEKEAEAESNANLAWPAPQNPQQAIDDLEYDLATLGPLLRIAPEQADGRAAYLLQLNPTLARSLRSRWRRWNRRWSEADGICVSNDVTQASLAASRITARPYSSTALQMFAVCPYRFFLSAIQHLDVREEPIPLQYIDPLTRGSLLHAVHARFAREAVQQQLFPLRPELLDQANEVLDSCVRAVADEYREQLMPAINRIWQEEVARIRRDLRAWLLRTAEPREDWVPTLIEFAFGLPIDGNHDPNSTEKPAVLEGGYQLRGVVDLVDRRQSTAELRVTDLKTGRNRTSDGFVIDGGKTLQPALYPLALEALGFGTPTAARLAYCTAEGGFTERISQLGQRTREGAQRVLETIDKAIEAVFLPPAPQDRACESCDYLAVCGPYEEFRFKRKEQDRLQPLLRLRGLR
jgi:ATP-dependent helicase/nuclease subunit B